MMFRPPNCLVFYKIQGFIVKMGRRWGQDGNKLGTRWGQDVNKIGTDMMVIRQGYDRDKIRLLTLHFLDSGGGKYSIPPPLPQILDSSFIVTMSNHPTHPINQSPFVCFKEEI